MPATALWPRRIAEAALAAERRWDYHEALRLCQLLVARRKVKPVWSERYAANLITVGRLDEAAAILAAARRQYPWHIGLEVCCGLLAAAREDWTTAVDILARFHARDPANPVAREHLGRVLQLRALASVDSVATLAPLPVDIGRTEDATLCELLLGFESLGNDCEFGLVQRHYGAEPLGLFRWNLTTSTSLLLGLATRFDGLGDPAYLELIVDPLSKLYLVRDVRFDFEMHTFIFEGQGDTTKLFDKMCKVLSYLRDRFLDDLKTARKILVYKDLAVDQDFIQALHGALRTYGPVDLLWVMPIDGVSAKHFAGRAAGEVIEFGTGLYAGFLSRFGSADGTWDIPFDEWVALCSRMATVARRAEAERPPTPCVAR